MPLGTAAIEQMFDEMGLGTQAERDAAIASEKFQADYDGTATVPGTERQLFIRLASSSTVEE